LACPEPELTEDIVYFLLQLATLHTRGALLRGKDDFRGRTTANTFGKTEQGVLPLLLEFEITRRWKAI